MNNVSSIHNCYGCGLCAVVCVKKIISIESNVNGFYEPMISNTKQCTECGLCIEVCSFSNKDIALQQFNIHSYAAWSNDELMRRKCSSGGIGFEIGRQLIEKGYKVSGVRYNVEKVRAEHYIATTVQELMHTIGSKYIQSYTVDGFKAINRKEKYLITGTPCQIDSFRRYIRKFHVEENFILLDFFCHSVPSMLAWQKYTKMIEKRIGRITSVAWRDKQTGWHDSYSMVFNEGNGESVHRYDSDNGSKGKDIFINSRLSQGNIFYRLFLGDFCCNPACEKSCKFKYRSSSADIRVGDCWGSTYEKDEKGVSALITYTERGQEVVASLQGCTIMEHPFDVVAELQMKKNVNRAYLSSMAWKMLKSSKNFSSARWHMLIEVEKLLQLPNKVVNKLVRIFK